MSELRQFQFRAGLILAGALAAVAAILLVLGHGSAVSGLVAGGVLGFANLTWMVSSATRLMGLATGARVIQVVALIRFLIMACLLGLILIIGHVNPVAAVAGYGLVPIAAAAAGWQFLGRGPVPL